jgi:radical SAM protein with 4Fe4S-binding SPASM domain
MPLPAYVQIEPVGQCNLRCTMCAIPFREDGPPHGPLAFMDFVLYRRLVDEMEGKVGHLHLQGLGEPTMHPRFFEMVNYAHRRGIRVTTNTNMTLLNARRARLAVGSGLDTIYASIDAADPETYASIRVRGRLETVLANLAHLRAARADRPHPRLVLVAVVMRRNLAELPALVRLAAEFEMSEMFVQHLSHEFREASLPARYAPMRDYVSAETLLGEDPARIEAAFQAARSEAARHRVPLRLPSVRPRGHRPGTPGRERCDWPFERAYIAYDGQAMPCCMVSTPDRASMGSVKERALGEVWEDEPYREFRRQLSSEQPPAVCSSCALYSGTF